MKKYTVDEKAAGETIIKNLSIKSRNNIEALNQFSLYVSDDVYHVYVNKIHYGAPSFEELNRFLEEIFN